MSSFVNVSVRRIMIFHSLVDYTAISNRFYYIRIAVGVTGSQNFVEAKAVIVLNHREKSSRLARAFWHFFVGTANNLRRLSPIEPDL